MAYSSALVSEVTVFDRILMQETFLKEIVNQEKLTKEAEIEVHRSRLQVEFTDLFSDPTCECVMLRIDNLEAFGFLQKRDFGYHINFLGVVNPANQALKMGVLTYMLEHYAAPFYAHLLPNNPLRKIPSGSQFMGLEVVEWTEHPLIPAAPHRNPAAGWSIVTLS